MAARNAALVVDIYHDIQRHIITYVLLVLVVFSALSVVYFTHVNRQTTSELEVKLTERDELDIEWRNLLIEQNSLAEHSAIEIKASKMLDMKRPDANSEVVIKLP